MAKSCRKDGCYYNLKHDAKILDIGCGKGYLLFDFLKVMPEAKIFGMDISKYAIANSKEEIKSNLIVGDAQIYPTRIIFLI